MQTGECVSCGRRPGGRYPQCPYCDERVWKSPAYRLFQWTAWVLPPVMAGVFMLFIPLDFNRCLHFFSSSAALCPSVSLIVGFMVLLSPVPDDPWICTSHGERWRMQMKSFLFHALLGFCTGIPLICLMTDPIRSDPRLLFFVGLFLVLYLCSRHSPTPRRTAFALVVMIAPLFPEVVV